MIAGGGGVVVLEELEHARARGAKIYAEVTGYGATSDGYDMVAPSGRGRRAGDAAGDLDASATAGSATSTRTAPRRRSGDISEVEAIRRVFGAERDAEDLARPSR